jgi:hypothetical protein
MTSSSINNEKNENGASSCTNDNHKNLNGHSLNAAKDSSALNLNQLHNNNEVLLNNSG